MATWDQVFWNILHHGAPLSTPNAPFIPQNMFGFHFSPVVLLLLPFYALWPHVELLQIVQSLCFGFAGMALFYALKAAGAKEWEAWAGCALYWFNPFVLSAAIWDFHEIAFATLFIAIALWGLCAKRFAIMLSALILLLLTKEHYGLSVAGFGFLWGWRHRDWRRGALLIVSGIVTLTILLAWVIPTLHGGTHFMWTHSGTSDRYSWMSEPWPKPLHTLWHLWFENADDNIPGLINLLLLLMSGYVSVPGLLYVILLLTSGLLLPLAGLFYLAPAGADIFANLLSFNYVPRSIVAYHSAAIIPVVVIAAYQGYSWLTQKCVIRKSVLAGGTLIMIIPLFNLALLPFTFWELNHIQLSPDRTAIAHIHDLLPPGDISVQSNVGVFFSAREAIYPFPYGIKQSSAVILHLANPFSAPSWKYSDQPYGEPAFQYFPHLRTFMRQPGWYIAYWQPPWLVMKRGAARRDERTMRTDIMQHIDRLDTIPN
jgi:uncharacterized membrane protein